MLVRMTYVLVSITCVLVSIGMHFKLLKSDNICSIYTNLNIEKYAVVLAGKPITTDI
jgi:hypothetical protein